MKTIRKTAFVILLISISTNALIEESNKQVDSDNDNAILQHPSNRNARILLPPYKSTYDDELPGHNKYIDDDETRKSIGPYRLHPKNEPRSSKNIDNEEKESETDIGLKTVYTRDSRILWPYPLYPSNATKENTNSTNSSNKEDSGSKRKERLFFSYSYPHSPVFNMVMKSMAINYTPKNQFDPFDFLRDSYPLPKGFTQPLDEYDYIIVGAGSAGSVLASRLSEKEGTTRPMVLLLEAGKPEMLLTDVPALVPLFQLTDYTWQYSVEPQPGICLGSENQRCFWPRGKAVGGTSVTNYMLYTRGRPQDWDRIAADGNYGWSYNDVLRYYLKSERASLKKFKNSPYHNRDGELNVEDVPIRTRLSDAFLEATRQHGYPTVDYNAPEQVGFGYVQATINRGHRHSAAKAFLHPHKRRKNLHILSEARATKVIIEPQTKRVYAVEYIKDGVKKTVRCRREVILSAGPIASPQLLMLSGVGPKEHLQSHSIPVIQDLPVGRNLYDHITFPGVIFKLNTSNISILESKMATIDNVMQWLHFGDGLLSSTGLIEALGYIKTKVSDDPEFVPDVEIMSMGGSLTSDSGNLIRKAWKLTDEAYSAYAPLNGLDTWGGFPMLLHPKSKGFLELKDSNPMSFPKIYSNYFSDQKDIETMLEGIKFLKSLGESEPFKKFGAQLHYPKHRECLHTVPGSDEFWECALRVMVMSLHHQIATCRMGPSTDNNAVVDPELRVYGLVGLRVVDSSIIPRTIGAHTNAPAIMIGEKAADLIKSTWTNVLSNKV